MINIQTTVEFIKTRRGYADLEGWSIIRRDCLYLFRMESVRCQGKQIEVLGAVVEVGEDLYEVVDIETGCYLYPYTLNKETAVWSIVQRIVKSNLDTLLLCMGFAKIESQKTICSRRLKEATGRTRLNGDLIDSLTPRKVPTTYGAGRDALRAKVV